MATRRTLMARGQSRGQRARCWHFALCSLLFALRRYHPVRPTRRRSAAAGAKANPAIGNREAIAEGEKLYNETCTACHGKDGNGGELGPPVAAQNRRYLRRTDDEIFDAMKNGISGTQMPPFSGQFTDDQVWRITAYIRGLRGTAVDTPAAGNVAGGEASSGARGTAEAATWSRPRAASSAPICRTLAARAKCRTSSTR